MTGEKLQAIYNTAEEIFYLSLKMGSPRPVATTDITEKKLIFEGFELTEQEVKEGFRILERSGFVTLGSGGVFGNGGKTIFIEDFF